MKKIRGSMKRWRGLVAGLSILAGLWVAGEGRLLPSLAISAPPASPAISSDDACDLPMSPGQGSAGAVTIPVRLIRNPATDLAEGSSAAAPAAPGPAANVMGGDIVPCRSIEDPYPILHSVAVDAQNNMVVMSDSNRGTLLFYNRTSGSTAERMTESVWQVSGPATGMMFVAGVAVDPARREAYTVDNDIGNRMMVFSYGEQGNAKPERVLFVPHGSWGISLNQRRDEIAISVEHINTIVIYRREASGAEAPLRVISGIHTGLADPHGVFWDEAHDEIFVTNHGNWAPMAAGLWGIYSTHLGAMAKHSIWAPASNTANRSMGGHFYPPSIRVFPGAAKGDVSPLHVISGPRTGLNWPMGIAVDAIHNEIAVANYGNNSILIFRRTDHGNVAPVRVIHGNLTGIAGPMGVAIDVKNDELWVTNAATHSALVFSRTAEGNVAPKRVLRNAPPGAPVVGFGNPGALAYDSKRDELLVPN